MEKQQYLSQSKYAEHRNVTKGCIGRLIKEGRLHLIKGKLNVAMSDAELDNKSNDDNRRDMESIFNKKIKTRFPILFKRAVEFQMLKAKGRV